MGRSHVSSGSPYETSIGFSRAVKVGNHVFVSGTAPIGETGGAYAQTIRVLEIIKAALEEAGGKLENVVRTRIYLVDVADYPDVSRAHGEYFSAIRPASTMIAVAALLQPEWKVEIEADAIIE